ncbi:hypothetical protein M408DRAFT_30898 [Serendipita vermifera MAFF 305830]|uniref:PNPLA domain-containing protein n=1 Tax=Serendipita vermifera MAFF 305830 TaxID=933852 RepID=A0A0C2WQB3_SERVB|nr:hypothetical protein M408DRAFT_30898 [Serendipita vermifera MAFF 305830]
MEPPKESEKGICIVSFDGGGPGSISQLIMMQEILQRSIEDPSDDYDEACLTDCWDMMGGVGFGGLSALMLGCLRLSVEQTMSELATIGSTLFTQRKGVIATPDANTNMLKEAIEDLLKRHQYPISLRLKDKTFRNGRCKVVVFAATTTTMDHCHPFRAYPHRGRSIDCTFVEAACATLAIPEYFAPIVIGPPLREQRFIGTPLGSNNPIRQVLEEARLQFGDEKQVSLILSLGSGRPNAFSFDSLDLYPDNHGNLLTQLMLGCERVARELSFQMSELPAYLRLNVDKGVENMKLTDWDKLGDIEGHTDVYLQLPDICDQVENASRALLSRVGSISLGGLNRARPATLSRHPIQQRHSQVMLSPVGVKQMRDIIRDVESITLIDAIGNHIRIPMEWCRTYAMLADILPVYFKHQKLPGSSFIERGDYRLVSGECRDVVQPAEWTYIAKAGSTMEMSMVIHTRNEYAVRCPRCQTVFEGQATNGWASCSGCSGMFQTEEKGANHLVSPAVASPNQIVFGDGTTMDNESDERERFRLISMIRELLVRTPSYQIQL